MLHLTAFDAEDLGVISAQMQDAVIRFADMHYLKKQRRFAIVANRFAWDALPERQRRRTGISFGDVTHVRRQGPQALGDLTVLSLLAITFSGDGRHDSLSGGHRHRGQPGASDAAQARCLQGPGRGGHSAQHPPPGPAGQRR